MPRKTSKSRTMPSADRKTAPPKPVNEIRIPFTILPTHLFPLDTLSSAHWNPPWRSDPDYSNHIRFVLDGIERTRTCANLWVTTPDREGIRRVIDGHIRRAALRLGGYTHAPCFEFEGDEHELFAIINERGKPLSSRDKLYVYLEEPRAVGDYMQVALGNMEKTVGRSAMLELCKAGGSYATYKQAKGVAEYCGRGDDPSFITKSLLWLVRAKGTYAVRRYMDDGRSPLRLRDSVENEATLAV